MMVEAEESECQEVDVLAEIQDHVLLEDLVTAEEEDVVEVETGR